MRGERRTYRNSERDTRFLGSGVWFQPGQDAVCVHRARSRAAKSRRRIQPRVEQMPRRDVAQRLEHRLS